MDKALKVEIEKEIMKWYVTPVEKDSYTKNLTSSLTALIIKWLEGKRKEKIDITKKMCHNLKYPSPCLYDEPNPNGATCTMQDKNIPKEKCEDYKDLQVEYEDFAERNQLITELIGELK